MPLRGGAGGADVMGSAVMLERSVCVQGRPGRVAGRRPRIPNPSRVICVTVTWVFKPWTRDDSRSVGHD
jgi:hypothetical protein